MHYNNKKEATKTHFPSSANSDKNSQSIQFKNNRPEATRQLKVQEMANSTVQRKKNKTGMPDQLKSGIENLSGMNMSDVKVHYNSSKPAQLQAHAYAQGNQIHLAPGQEKHLAHEAWHVVQQKQGRVSPTKQLKSKVNINDDASLEKEANVMGSKALQFKKITTPFLKKRNISSNVKQLRTLGIAGLNGNFVEVKADVDIFDSPRMKKGWQYNLATTSNNNNYTSVIDKYTTMIRPLGNNLSSQRYTDDRFSDVQQMPGKIKWGQTKQQLLPKYENDNIIIKKRAYFDNYDNAKPIIDGLNAKDRSPIRNNNHIEAIDPFVSKITVTPTTGLNRTPWEIDTQFADSGSGYITKIKKGDQDISGSIATRPDFEGKKGKNGNPDIPGKKDETTGNKDDYSFSSTHEQTTGSFGSKVDAMTGHSPGDTKGKDHEGFDAITWMAAEGARFRPVKTLGARATPQTKFFIFPSVKNWQTIKAVDSTWLMQKWGVVFHKKYNIPSKRMAAVVQGQPTITFPKKGLMYNLNTGKIIDAQKYRKWRAKNNWQKLESLNMVTGMEVRAMKKNVAKNKTLKKAYFLAGRPGHERPDPVG